MKKLAIIALASVLTIACLLCFAVLYIAYDDVARLRASLAASPQLPHGIRAAIIAAEDPYFLARPSLSLGSLRALRPGVVSCGPAPLASVLVRNAAPGRRALRRHIENSIEAYVVSRAFDPEELLRIFAHEAYLGSAGGRTIVGVEPAARAYFEKEAADLTVPEAAMLAAMLRAPRAYSPETHPDRALHRRNLILRQMRGHGFIDDAALQRALRTPLRVVSSR